MTLKKQSIRKGMHVVLDGRLVEKDELIQLSESWTESQENFFRKMLKQGGEFKIQGKKFNITLQDKILDSTGKKDTGVITIPGLDSRF
jgi:hypothetical protein